MYNLSYNLKKDNYLIVGIHVNEHIKMAYTGQGVCENTLITISIILHLLSGYYQTAEDVLAQIHFNLISKAYNLLLGLATYIL